MSARVFVWAQGLLGSGHRVRIGAIADQLIEEGCEVALAYGGVDGRDAAWTKARLLDLPGCRSIDAGFSTLIDEDGQPIDDAWRARRRAILLRRLNDFAPDLVVTELFPFGRRAFRFELLPLLRAMRAMRPRPRLAASVRDILVTKTKPGRVAMMRDWALAHYDRILVHGDPRLIDFEASFPHHQAIAEKIRYTGYVVRPAVAARASRPPTPKDAAIVVSAGGGAVGGALLDAALEARARGAARDLAWRVVAGPGLAEDRFRRLKADHPDIAIARRDPDLAGTIARSKISLSQAGYNTVAEAWAGRTAMILAPFGEGAESEQRVRAEAAARAGVAVATPPGPLRAETIAAALARLGQGPARFPPLDFDGAGATARALAALARRGP